MEHDEARTAAIKHWYKLHKLNAEAAAKLDAAQVAEAHAMAALAEQRKELAQYFGANHREQLFAVDTLRIVRAVWSDNGQRDGDVTCTIHEVTAARINGGDNEDV